MPHYLETHLINRPLIARGFCGFGESVVQRHCGGVGNVQKTIQRQVNNFPPSATNRYELYHQLPPPTTILLHMLSPPAWNH